MIDTKLHVTKELAVETFEKVIEELGADTVISTCQIFVYEGAESKKLPSCAVGQVYARLVDDNLFQQNENQALPSYGWDAFDALGFGIESDTVAGYLQRLQIVQDDQVPWGKAHEIALDVDKYKAWRGDQ